MSENASSVEQFARDLIALGGVFNVDDAGYIVNKVDVDDMVYLKIGNQLKRLMIIKEKGLDTDAAIINPLNENLTETMEAKWLYVMLNAGLVRRINAIAKFVSEVVESEKSGNPIPDLPTSTVAFISKHKNFDNEVLKQFLQITKDPTKFMSIWYNRKLRESICRCSIYDAATKVEFPQIKAKTWKIIIDFVSAVLDVDRNIEHAEQQIRDNFSVRSEVMTAPKLESMLILYSKIYDKLNHYLDMCEMVDDPDFVVDLTTLAYHIEHLDEYYRKAKWFVTASSAIPTRQQPTSQLQPDNQNRSNIPINPAVVQNEVPQVRSNIPVNPNMIHSGNIIPTQPQYMFNQQPQSNIIPTQQMGGFGTGNIIPTQPVQYGPGMIIPTR